MSVTRVDFWRIQPGRLEDALSLYSELRRMNARLGAGEQHLWRGLISGDDTALFYSTARFSSMASLGEFGARLAASPESVATAARLDSPESPLVCRSSIAMRELAAWGTDINDGGSAALVRTFELRPDRWAEFFDIVEASSEHALRYGAIVGLHQITVGGDRIGKLRTQAVFPDLGALGNYVHEFEHDPELRSVQARILGPDTPARLLATSIDCEVGGEEP